MGHSLGFQERWEFRRKEVNEDSSSDDDSKSNSEEALKNQRLVVDEDYHSGHDPTQIEEPEGLNHGTKGKPKSKSKKPRKKQQKKVIKRNKVVNDKIQHCAVKKDGRRKTKGSASAYDLSLIEEFKNFSESLLEDMKVTAEKMFVKMKQEMYELVYNGPPNWQTNERSNQVRMRYAQAQHQRNFRYNQMQLGHEIFQSPNANGACDFPQVQYQKGVLLGGGLPSTSLNQSFVMSGGSEAIKSINVQHQHNYVPGEYPLERASIPASSGRVDSNGHDFIHHQNLPADFSLGMLPRNEERGQLHAWRTSSCSSLYGPEITGVEAMTNCKPDVPMVDGRVAFHDNFSGPIILREREREQGGRLLPDPKFTLNFSTHIASSHIRGQSISPSTNYQLFMDGGNNSLAQTNLGSMMNQRAPSYMPHGMLMPPQNPSMVNRPHFGN